MDLELIEEIAPEINLEVSQMVMGKDDHEVIMRMLITLDKTWICLNTMVSPLIQRTQKP